MKQLILSLLLPVTGIALGLILVWLPGACIEFQRRAYLLINWRMEPISMDRELNNTRLLGFGLTSFSLIGLVFVLFK